MDGRFSDSHLDAGGIGAAGVPRRPSQGSAPLFANVPPFKTEVGEAEPGGEQRRLRSFPSQTPPSRAIFKA